MPCAAHGEQAGGVMCARVRRRARRSWELPGMPYSVRDEWAGSMMRAAAQVGEKELSKMRKRAEKEERGARAALAAHQVRPRRSRGGSPCAAASRSAAAAPALAVLHGCSQRCIRIRIAPLAAAGSMQTRTATLLSEHFFPVVTCRADLQRVLPTGPACAACVRGARRLSGRAGPCRRRRRRRPRARCQSSCATRAAAARATCTWRTSASPTAARISSKCAGRCWR